MLISKFNLYQTEWLDLVFDKRNKDYGAYELRQHYAGTMVKAMGITFLSIGALCAGSIIFSSAPSTIRIVPVDITPQNFVQPPVKKVEPPAPKHLPAEKQVKPVQTIKNLPPVVTTDDKAEKPVKNEDLLNKVIGQTTSLKGTGGDNIDLPVENSGGGGNGTAPVTDNSVHLPGGLDVMPEPVGGINAWSKFLNKNLRFPVPAQEEGISGKVLLSFIIEKDGSLSNIAISQGAGHGFDEEALRVLKLAKAWKPGMQNGQPVRVRYIIPINFQLSE